MPFGTTECRVPRSAGVEVSASVGLMQSCGQPRSFKRPSRPDSHLVVVSLLLLRRWLWSCAHGCLLNLLLLFVVDLICGTGALPAFSNRVSNMLQAIVSCSSAPYSCVCTLCNVCWTGCNWHAVCFSAETSSQARKWMWPKWKITR